MPAASKYLPPSQQIIFFPKGNFALLVVFIFLDPILSSHGDCRSGTPY